MNEHPILFSTPMVQANLDGRKRMTRRMTGFDNVNEDPDAIEFVRFQKYEKDGSYRAIFKHEDADGFGSVKCPYGQPGDLLWVRESFIEFPEGEFNFKDKPDPVFIQAKTKWKPSIHMPKDAARIWLQVKEIRVERLQDISEEDAIAEGVDNHFHEDENHFFVYPPKDKTKGLYAGPCLVSGTYVSKSSAFGGDTPWKYSFRSLLNHINDKDIWKANPWVWVVKYKVLSTTGKPTF